MRIVLVRHGHPDYEKDCLTELGLKQADIAAQRLLDEGIEEIFSSPLGRAQQTAEAFSKASGIKKIVTLDFMREIRYGKSDALYESGNPWLLADELVKDGWDLNNPEWRNHPYFVDNLATADADLIAKKTDDFLTTLGYEREGKYYRCKDSRYSQKTIAIFCHGGSTSDRKYFRESCQSVQS